MEFVGKCPPDADSLAAAADRGFDAVELYLVPAHVDDLDAVVDDVAAAPVDVVSVHTPHVTPDDPGSFERADTLADRLDAYLVVHTQYAQHLHVPELERIGFDADYGYENNPGASRYHLENAILEAGHDLVLDTGHLYVASEAYLDALEAIVARHAAQIRVVHLTDATRTRDNLPLQAGEVDVHATLAVLARHHEGPVVLEVPPDDQQAALELVRETSATDRDS